MVMMIIGTSACAKFPVEVQVMPGVRNSSASSCSTWRDHDDDLHHAYDDHDHLNHDPDDHTGDYLGQHYNDKSMCQ